MCLCSHGCPVNPVTKDWLGQLSFDLRPRTGWNGLFGVHGGKANVTMASDFATTMDAAMNYFNSVAFTYGGSTVIDWIGNVGATGCKPGRHPLGRAIDITAIRMANRVMTDMNVSWRPDRSVAERRRYLAFLCAMRIHMSDVLPYYFDAAHQNHVHCDNNVLPTPPLREGSGTDVKLVKLIVNLQLGWNLDLNNPKMTQEARDGYLYVTTANRTQCHDAFGSAWGMIAFLDMVCKNAIAGRGVGFHKGGC